MSIVLVDAMNLCYRHWKTQQSMGNTYGVGTALVHGFIKTLISMKKKIKEIDKYIICWDGGKVFRKNMYLEKEDLYKDFKIMDKGKLVEDINGIAHYRNKINAGYKGTRDKDENIEDLYAQIAYLKEYLDAMGFLQVIVDEVEADDVIYYLAKHYYTDKKVMILSNDTDFFQLLSEEHISQIVPKYEKTPDKAVIVDKYNFSKIFSKHNKEKGYELPLELYLFQKAVIGDSSDNVCGLFRVGEKTLLSLLQECNYDLETLANKEEELLKKKDTSRLILQQEMIDFCYSIIDLDYSYPFLKDKLETAIEQVNIKKECNDKKVEKLARKYELNEFLSELKLNLARIKEII